MVSSFEEFDPLTDVGVPTLVIVNEDDDPTALLDGSSRSGLFVILGPSDLRVQDSGLSLMEHDSAYRLEDLDRIL